MLNHLASSDEAQRSDKSHSTSISSSSRIGSLFCRGEKEEIEDRVSCQLDANEGKSLERSMEISRDKPESTSQYKSTSGVGFGLDFSEISAKLRGFHSQAQQFNQYLQDSCHVRPN